MADNAAQSLELRPYQRFYKTYLIMTVGLPSLLWLALSAASGTAFWLLPILFIGGLGALNFYLFSAARPIPQRVNLDAQGIAFTTKAGADFRFVGMRSMRFKITSEVGATSTTWSCASRRAARSCVGIGHL